MKKKLILSITGVTVLLTSLWVLQPKTYSHGNVPYQNPESCIQETANEMAIMKAGWMQNVESLMEQEKPASEMVDEAFESMRTYRCWLDYLCKMVLMSAHVPPEFINADPITREHVNPIHGCAKPQDILIPGTRLHFLSECKVTDKKTVSAGAFINYDKCKRITNLDFAPLKGKDGEPSDARDKTAIEQFKNQSSAFIALEGRLKQNSSDQKNSALQNKLGSIIIKMRSMESHATFLKEQINKFNQLLPCYASKCT